MDPKIAVIIPARYGSSRFPGKPLAMLSGRPMLEHVVSKATTCRDERGVSPDFFIGVATDDSRIVQFCEECGINVALTSSELRTGTDRAQAALSAFGIRPDIIVNLQGDNPLVPAAVLSAVLKFMLSNSKIEAATPVIRLSWDGLDQFREAKKTTPLSGTTCIVSKGRALWFSKQIIPLIRDEGSLRKASNLSPVFRHIGLYAVRLKALERFAALPQGEFEELEGLEQLRFLENGMAMHTVEVPFESMPPLSGIDSLEDLKRAEKYLEGC